MNRYTTYWWNVITTSIVGGLLFVLSTPVVAATIAYEQAPGHFGGFGSDGQSLTVADDFQLAQPTTIRNMTWWGGYLNENLTSAPPDNFTIRLFTDNGGQPGALVHTFTVGKKARRVATGDYVNPPDLGFRGYAEFKYSYNLPTPFLADANTRYWLSIVNVPRQESWLWEMSGSQENLGVQRSFTDPVSGPWEPFFDNTAFQLQTEKVR